MRKRGLFIAVLSILVLNSCGSNSSSSVEELKECSLSILVRSEKQKDAIKEINANYQKETGITLKISYKSSEAVAANQKVLPCDLCFGPVASLDQASYQDDVEILSDDYRQDVVARMDESTVKAFQWKDSFPTFPVGIAVNPYLAYNKTIFAEEDVASWDDIIRTLQPFSSVKKVAFLGLSAMDYFGAFCANGLDTTIATDGNSDNFNSEQGLKVAKGLSKLLSRREIDEGASTLERKMHPCAVTSFFFEDVTKPYYGDNIAYSRLPSFSYDGETYEWAPYYVTASIAVKKQKDPAVRKAIMDFASYLSRQDSLLSAYGDPSLYSPYKESNRTISNHAWLTEGLDKAKDWSSYPSQWMGAMDKLMQAVKDDAGQLNDEKLTAALNQYHESVMKL